MKKDINNIEKQFWRIVACVVVFFIVIVGVRNIEDKKEKEREAEVIKLELQQKEKGRLEAKKEDERKKEEASKTVQTWIEYKNKDKDASYDEKNKALNVSLNFGRTLSISKRIEMANYSIYETTKEFESLFKDDIDSYKFDFSAELVDNYGNKRKDVVYSIILNRNELNKVNWDGIQPSMLINLASHNYKSPALQ